MVSAVSGLIALTAPAQNWVGYFDGVLHSGIPMKLAYQTLQSATDLFIFKILIGTVRLF